MSPPLALTQLHSTHHRVLELFAGIGGLASAWPAAEIVAAVDINQIAAKVYRQNFSHRYLIQEIESLSDSDLVRFGADFWWLSPPCQPFSRRGQRLDLEDRRCGGLLRIIEAIGHCQPEAIGLENVVGFAGSRAHTELTKQLKRHDYHVQSRELCPSEMGWPNRRRRFYLIASRVAPMPWQPLPNYNCRLEELLDRDLTPASNLAQPPMLPAEDARRYYSALDRIDLSSPALSEHGSVTACFAGSYGKTLLHAGSYLQWGAGYRRFSPREVARLLGFPDHFRMEGLAPRACWKLLGNSLSLPVMRYVLSHVPDSSHRASPNLK